MKLKGLVVTCAGKPVEAYQTTGKNAARRLTIARRNLEKAFPGCKIERFTQSLSDYSRSRKTR